MEGTKRMAVKVVEAAEMLGIGRSFAYKLISEGRLPCIRLGSRIVIPIEVILQLLQKAKL